MEQLAPLNDLQLLDALETRLGRLAARWRGSTHPAEAEAIVSQYQAVLLWMIEMGYRDALDVDAELPDEYLPNEYLSLHSA